MGTTKSKPFVFVLMPFSAEFDDVYNLGIRPACEAVGAYAERVDKQFFMGSITQRIYKQIATADVVVADMTGQNPNVFYEVGYAHALRKEDVVLLSRGASGIPFNLVGYNHIIYDRIDDLIPNLKKMIDCCLENRGGVPAQTRVVMKRDFKSPSVQAFRESQDAYEALASMVREYGAEQIDLIQFSGQTVHEFLRTIAGSTPRARVRLLLQHPDVASQYDQPGPKNSQVGRIRATLSHINLLREQHERAGFSVETRFYRSPASVSMIKVDDDLLTLGWYHFYKDSKSEVVRVRGHNAPAIFTRGPEGASLRHFASTQFELLWRYAEPAEEED